jgi:hypothetical protein
MVRDGRPAARRPVRALVADDEASLVRAVAGMSRLVINVHHGITIARSDGPGRGGTFDVTLPATWT